jgi:hypothetical protein
VALKFQNLARTPLGHNIEQLVDNVKQILISATAIPASDRVPSFAADESGHSATYSLNVGNLRDTGH